MVSRRLAAGNGLHSAVTEAQYLDALVAMVECLEDRDPDVTASTIQALDYVTFEWEKPADAEGRTSLPALSECRAIHLDPLE